MKEAKITLNGFGVCKIAIAFLFFTATTIFSVAQTLTTLVDLTGTSSQSPSSLIQGYDGNFYGTTQVGGANNLGSAFKMTPSGSLTTLYSFCGQANCTDGEKPASGLVQATNGNFYGTTSGGGEHGLGSIFALTAKYDFKELYGFCHGLSCPDGEDPNGLIQATNGNLYGTTAFGGKNFAGTAFEMTPGGALTILHVFTGKSNEDNPFGVLFQAGNGNLYGTTTDSSGGMFEMTPTGTLTILQSFGLFVDGSNPSQLVQGRDGSLYGTMGYSGGTCDCGTVFKVTPANEFSTIYDFCSQANCTDGGIALGGLVLGSDGNFYGTNTSGGNSNSAGTIFKITPEGVLTTLYTFCSQANCTDGAYPLTTLLQGTDGNFYGTTSTGGLGGFPTGAGTIFRLSTGLAPFVKLVRNSGAVGQTGGIIGQGFTGTTGVFVNGTAASFTVVSDTFLRATIPEGATTGFVTVDTPSGTLTSNEAFRVTQ